jgi:ATP-binding cassette subfamily B protein
MREKQHAAIDSVETAANKLALVGARSSPMMETLGGFAIAIVVTYGGARVINDGAAPGAFFSFITALLLAYEPAKRLARLHVDLSACLPGVAMVYAFLEEPSAENEPANAAELLVASGRIELRDVRFSYRAGEPVLSGLSLIAEGGRTTALVGRSGAGKSTIMSAMLRYWELDSGAILIDGQDISMVSRGSLRRAVSYVSQETFLFKGTIRDNIALGLPSAGEEQIIAAAKAAHAHDFISTFELGYETPCGEHGMQLSGGQRQRIAIARAFLKNAPILLLDEATSALDTESERAVQAALDKLREGRTTLVIAHRLSTVRNADSICVIDNGKVAERGGHEALMARPGGLYDAMVRSQFTNSSTLNMEDEHRQDQKDLPLRPVLASTPAMMRSQNI